MHRLRPLIALSTLAAAGLAAAQSTPVPTRADVRAEARAAVKSGATAEGELTGDAASAPQPAVSRKPRSQVRREAQAANRNSETAKGESYRGPERAPATASVKSRADVKGEARATARQGTTPGSDAASYSGPPTAASGAARN